MAEGRRAHLVLGGARSGKSAFAEAQALAAGDVGRWVYVATARAQDSEMQDRIDRHRARRDPRWETVEAPLDLAAALARHDAPGTCVLVDCLTLWLTNALTEDCWPAEREALLAAVAASRARLLLVSNEVGSGVVPMGALSRTFVDEAGRLHQRLAATCARVTLVVAGLPTTLKDDCP